MQDQWLKINTGYSTEAERDLEVYIRKDCIYAIGERETEFYNPNSEEYEEGVIPYIQTEDGRLFSHNLTLEELKEAIFTYKAPLNLPIERRTNVSRNSY